MKVSAALPTGVAALLFESARRRRRTEDRLVARLEEAGYGEVILPILDYLEPYEALLTASARGELYRFIDRDGELLKEAFNVVTVADFARLKYVRWAQALAALDTSS